MFRFLESFYYKFRNRLNVICCCFCNKDFFMSNPFISKARLKLAKNQANATQHPEAKLLLFENYSHSLSTLSSNHNMAYSKKKQKSKCVCIHEIVRLIIIKMKINMKKRLHRHNINRPRSRHRHKYSKYEKCLTMVMRTCIRQHLVNI